MTDQIKTTDIDIDEANDKLESLRKAIAQEQSADLKGKLSSVLGFAEKLITERLVIKYSGTLDLTVSLVEDAELSGDVLAPMLQSSSYKHMIDESDSFTRVVLFDVSIEEVDHLIGLSIELVQSRLGTDKQD